MLQVVLVGRDDIVRLNGQYLGHSGPTDVLAFDFRGGPVPGEDAGTVAEIYVCLDVAVEVARRLGTSVGYEVVLYVVHGLLHLVGEDDHDAASRRRMRRAEARVLRDVESRFGLADLFDRPSPPCG